MDSLQQQKQEYMVAMQDYKTQIENYTSCPNLEDKRLLGVLAQVDKCVILMD